MRKARYGVGNQQAGQMRNWREGTGIMSVKSRLRVRWGIEEGRRRGKE